MILEKWRLKLQLEGARKTGLYRIIHEAAIFYDLPLEYVLAITSRETGIKNISGDKGHGRSVIQIDDRSHKEFIEKYPDFHANVREYVRYGCAFLAKLRLWAKRKWPHLTATQHLKIAAAAYNSGQGNVEAAVANGNCDMYTAHRNYGADVLRRMKTISEILEEEAK